MKAAWLKQNLPVIILFILFSVLYIYTTAPGVYDGDSGELAAAINTLGLAHPTGFPLYMLLGKFFTLLLPVGDVAYRLNIFSALLTATSLVFVYFVLKNLGRSTPTSFIASFVMGIGRNTIWANSGRVGVYPLSLLFVSILFFIFSKWRLKPKTGYLYLYGFLWGLSLGTHALMLIMGIPFILMLWQARSFLKSHVSILIKTVFVTILPGVQYIYLPFAYKKGGIINWGSMSSFHDFFYYITQRQYVNKMFTRTFSENTIFGKTVLELVANEFTIIFFCVAIFGLFILYRNEKKIFGLFAILAATNILMMLSYGKSEGDLLVVSRYLFIFDLVLVVAIAFALDIFVSLIKSSKKKSNLIVFIVILIPVLIFQFKVSLAANDRRHNYIVEDASRNILITLEPNSLVLPLGDATVGPMWYLQSINERRDVVIISPSLLSFDWYVNNIIMKYPTIASRSLLDINSGASSGKDRLEALIKDNLSKRPVYSVLFNSSPDHKLDQEFDFTPQGLTFKITPKGEADIKKILNNNKIIWGRYTLRNVKKDFYKDFMLDDLTKNYTAALYILALDYYNNGYFDEAIESFQKAYEIYPDSTITKNIDLIKQKKLQSGI